MNKLLRLLLERTLRCFIDVLSAKVRSHDDHSVFEVDHPSLTVTEASRIHHLQEERCELSACFLNLAAK